MSETTTAELLDGWLPYVSLLAVLGTPTRDGRTLAGDGSFELPTEVPLLGHGDQRVVGCVAGLTRHGYHLFAVGVAEPDTADALNTETSRLGMDLDGMKLAADPTVIQRGTIRAARVVSPERFAWTS